MNRYTSSSRTALTDQPFSTLSDPKVPVELAHEIIHDALGEQGVTVLECLQCPREASDNILKKRFAREFVRIGERWTDAHER